MATFLVGYDLRARGKDYKPLVDRLQSFGGWWHNLDSTWLIKSDLTTVQLRDELAAYLDGTDKLLVIDVSGRAAAWRGFAEAGSEWIKKFL